MIFGGLEIVAGGYLIHRHYRKKNEKERLEIEAQERRSNSFPGANPQHKRGSWNTQAQHRPQHHPQYQQPLAIVPEQQKYAHYGCSPVSPTPLPLYQYGTQPQPRPQRPTHSQSFNIPRRPVHPQGPAIVIQPSLQRSDSCATISRMNIADGTRPSNMPQHESPTMPPRKNNNNPGGLRPAPMHAVYGNSGFSMSTPDLGATPTSPGMTYAMATEQHAASRHTIDDNWETYGHGYAQPHYAPTVSTDLGERDPPPPYAP